MSIHTRTEQKRIEQEHLKRIDAETITTSKHRYKVNEIFYSIQGEGDEAGHAAVFVRFSACNLACTWCDTEYNSGVKMSAVALVEAVNKVIFPVPDLPSRKPLVILTGGEPSLQITDELLDTLKKEGYSKVSMETNGIKWKECMRRLQTICISPKTPDGWWVQDPYSPHLKVFKVVYDPYNLDLDRILKQVCATKARDYFLQPLEDQKTGQTNVKDVIQIVKNNPRWRLSLQTHKIMGVR